MKVEDAEFDEKVNTVQGQVDDLVEKANAKIDGTDAKLFTEIQALQQNLDSASGSVKNIAENLQGIEDKRAFLALEEKRFQMEKDAIQRELDNSYNHIEREGIAQLERARELVDRFGEKSPKLSEYAKESKDLINEQLAKQTEIEELSKSAASKSKQALSEANEAIYGAQTTSQQIGTLQQQLQDAVDRLSKTKELAEEQIKEAEAVYNEAAQTLSNVEGTKLPDVIPDDIKETAGEQNQESSLQLTNAHEKVEENREALLAAQRALAEASEAFRLAKQQHEEANRLLDQVEASRNRAQDAFDGATKIWNEAEASYNSLNEFNENIDASKTEALAQLDNLESIKEQIKEAQQITAEAEADIGSAKKDADDALKLALKSLEDAKKLAKEADDLKGETAETQAKSVEQKELLEKTLGDIKTIEGTTDELGNQAQSDSEKSNEVLRRSIQSESAAKNLKENFDKSIADLTRAANIISKWTYHESIVD